MGARAELGGTRTAGRAFESRHRHMLRNIWTFAETLGGSGTEPSDVRIKWHNCNGVRLVWAKGRLAVSISITVHPRDHMSACSHRGKGVKTSVR